MERDDEIMQVFLIESHENLDRMALDLVALEQQSDAATLDSVFRTIHTLKGSCGFVGLGKLERISHAGEALLVRLRSGELLFDRGLVSVLLTLLDAIREILLMVETHGHEGDNKHESLLNALQSLASCSQDSIPSHAKKRPPSTNQTPSPTTTTDNAIHRTTRVAVKKLDQLMDLFGGLVLGQNQLMQSPTVLQDVTLMARVKQQQLLIEEMHVVLLKTRMQPIASIWKGFPRVVRDTAVDCDKQVKLILIGEMTELGSGLLEKLKDPLLHLLRNAVDHGIEPTTVRKAAGKDPVGIITLEASQYHGQIDIAICDDGAGIDIEKIKNQAIKRGLIDVVDANHLADDAVLAFLFTAGFSTAETITHISGRGVGLDVVKHGIEHIGGYIHIDSVPQKGTTFHIRLPLTLAIMAGLVVRCGTQMFVIPQTSILALMQIDRPANTEHIKTIHGIPVYEYREQCVSLLRLDEVFGIHADNLDPHIVIIESNKKTLALQVDEIMDVQSIVVKPVPQDILTLGLYAGCTILANGHVALIIDMLGLLQCTTTIVQDTATSTPSATIMQKEKLLLAQTPSGGCLAIPLSLIYRIEKITCNSIERVHGHEVVQLYERVIPLIDMMSIPATNSWLKQSEQSCLDTTLDIVVCVEHGRYIGLIVGAVQDTVFVDYKEKLQASREGVAFTAVINQQVTEVVDITAIIRMTNTVFFEPQ